MPRTRTTRAVANLYGENQIQAILEAIRTSAFNVELQNTETPTAFLNLAGHHVFAVDLQDRRLYRYKDDSKELVYTFVRKSGWFDTKHDEKIWNQYQQTIQAQGDLGGGEALSTNLFRREEIEILIQSIKGMVFKIVPAPDDIDVESIQHGPADEEVFRFNRKTSQLFMVTPNTGAVELVYSFKPEPVEWFWSGTDKDLLRSLNQAIHFYQKTIQQVRMATYRQIFGRVMEGVIIKLVQLVDVAEYEFKQLEKVDSSHGGRVLHEDVARLLSKDTEREANPSEDPNENQ